MYSTILDNIKYIHTRLCLLTFLETIKQNMNNKFSVLYSVHTYIIYSYVSEFNHERGHKTPLSCGSISYDGLLGFDISVKR